MAKVRNWPAELPPATDSKMTVELKWLESSGIEQNYIEGFKDAADSLIESISKSLELDKLAYPACYLYQHYLEIHMKYLLWDCMNLGNIPTAKLPDHDLAQLWKQTRAMLEHEYPGADPKPLNEIEQMILVLHNMDQTGYGFRYWRNKKGEKTLKQAPSDLDLGSIRMAVGRIYEFFDAVAVSFRAEWDSKNFVEEPLE